MKPNFKYFLLAGLGILLLSSCHQQPYEVRDGYMYVQRPERRNAQTEWKLVWSDEFTKKQLDTTVWSRIGLFDTPKSWKTPVDKWREVTNCFRYISANDPRVVTFDGEHIQLKGIINPDSLTGDPRPYLTGGVYTWRKFAFQYGRIEVRARLDQAYGMWPAIWMLSETEHYQNQHNGEMDIMEKLNHDDFAFQTTHNHHTIHLKKELPPKSATGKIDTLGYNIYSLSWYPDSLVYAINGVKTYTYPKVEENNTLQWPFDQPYYLFLDQQMEHEWPGKITNPDQLPISMDVDWVRLYQ